MNHLRDHVYRFAVACEDEPRIVAAYLGGSLAKGTADRYSDIDVYVVTAPGDYDSLWADRQEFMRRWGNHVSLIDVVDFEGLGWDMVLFTLEDGVEGEVAFGHTDNFMSLHGGPHEVLLDRVGLLEGVEFPLFVPGPEHRRSGAERALRRFWREATHFAKSWARGDLAGAIEILHRMRRSVMAITAGPAPDWSWVPLERQAMLVAATRLVELFDQCGRTVADEFGLEYPAEHAAVARRVFDDWTSL